MDLNEARVLLVEDDDSLIDMVEVAFQGEGISLEVARTGKEGVEKALQVRPHLILMDVIMPEMNGYEAAKKIKGHPATKDIPIFFLTARSLENDVENGKKAGAELYMVKPFSPFELLKVIRDFLRPRSL